MCMHAATVSSDTVFGRLAPKTVWYAALSWRLPKGSTPNLYISLHSCFEVKMVLHIQTTIFFTGKKIFKKRIALIIFKLGS